MEEPIDLSIEVFLESKEITVKSDTPRTINLCHTKTIWRLSNDPDFSLNNQSADGDNHPPNTQVYEIGTQDSNGHPATPAAKIISASSDTASEQSSASSCDKSDDDLTSLSDTKCTTVFPSRDSRHTSTNTNQAIEDSIVTNEQPMLVCPECSAKYTSRRKLYQHMESHKPNAWVCKVCSKHFPSASRLKQHATKHREELYCNQCDFTTLYSHELKSHGLTHLGPSAREKFQCRYCKDWFPCRKDLRNHEHMHTKISIYQCPQCDNQYQLLTSLRRHLQSHGEKKDRFGCEICGKKFSNRSHWNVHRKRHFYSYPCPQCNSSFSDKYGLKRHMLLHNTPSGEQFACSECPKKFATKEGMQLHVNRHFQLFTCHTCAKSFSTRYVLKRHETTCAHRSKDIQASGIHKYEETTIQESSIPFVVEDVIVNTTSDCTSGN